MAVLNMDHRVLQCLFVLVSTASAGYFNFTTTCENAVLHTSRTGFLSQLTASCVTTTGASTGINSTDTPLFHNSTLDLNLCLGIDYTSAALVWSIYGKFSEYCSRCHVVGRTRLGCSCATLSGVQSNSTIDLDSGISNINGTLSCQGGIGMDA